MAEDSPDIERPRQIFVSPQSAISDFIAYVGVTALVAAVALVVTRPNISDKPPNGGIAVVLIFVFFAFLLFLSVSRRQIAEVDFEARRLRISRRWFGRWTRTVVDCPFDECSALGTFETDADGHLSYSAYVKLKNGTRHAIPLQDSTLSEAARVASQLSTATGIPRLDIYSGPIYSSPDDTSRR